MLLGITPIFKKKGSKLDMQNYRPISVLPMMSKIFEKCIHKRLIDFCSHFSIINPNQYGFQTGKSTELAVI